MALQHHRKGELAEAKRIYGMILESDPKQSDTRHLMGVVALQEGQYQQAVQMIREAMALKPDQGGFHSNLGQALMELGGTFVAPSS